MPSVVFFDEAFVRLVNNPGGGVARKLRDVGADVVTATKDHLSTPRPAKLRKNETGVPFLRTGDLMNSVRATLAFDAEDRTLEVVITAPSIHDGLQYSSILVEDDFDLVPPMVRQHSD